MKTIIKQSIAQSLREGLTSYLNNENVTDDGIHFTQEWNGCTYSTPDAIEYLFNWIECEYDNSENEDKGTIEEWKEICIEEFIDFLELEDWYFNIFIYKVIIQNLTGLLN